MRKGAKQRRAKELRSAMTDAEATLWVHLRDRSMLGWKFRRQHPVGPFIVDFVCLEAGVVVEADGGQHADARRDASRDRYLEDRGYLVLRFWNHEILGETAAVLDRVLVVLRPSTNRLDHQHFVLTDQVAPTILWLSMVPTPPRGRLKGNPVRPSTANSGAAPQR